MSFPEKLTAALMELEQDAGLKEMTVEVEPSGSGRFVAIVESPSFDQIADYVRQNMVWGKILERLNDYEQRSVEFVFTPSTVDEEEFDKPPQKPKKSAKRRRSTELLRRLSTGKTPRSAYPNVDHEDSHDFIVNSTAAKASSDRASDFHGLQPRQCCCCHKALDVLQDAQRRFGFAIEEVDIDRDPELVLKFDTEVPVVAVNGKVRFRGVVNPALLERLLLAESRDRPGTPGASVTSE